MQKAAHSWRMRCMLAGSLIQQADIIILDEPINFLDLLEIIWLENYFAHLRTVDDGRIMMLVSHDRDFLNNVCDETIILKDQTLAYFKGNLSAYEEDLGAQKLYWGRMKEAQNRQIVHTEAVAPASQYNHAAALARFLLFPNPRLSLP